MKVAEWQDYSVIATGDGYKLEKWGGVTLLRPDPQVIWKSSVDMEDYKGLCAKYLRSETGGGKWIYKGKMPEEWTVSYGDLKFKVKPMGFKHTGLFPEQAVNWDWFSALIKNSGRPIRILNLFAYTGGATVAALASGAEVVHVDASKGMVTWAKENVISSGLGDRFVRFIVDDVKKFVQREFRRGREYDAIIMDPPSYGRGPGGEVWRIEDELYPLIEDCMKIMSDDPLFFLINSYTTGLSQTVLSNVLQLTMQKRYGGQVSADEIGLPIADGKLVLPCGISGRWEK